MSKMALDQIEAEMDSGDFVGTTCITSSTIVPFDRIETELKDIGSDLDFFDFLKED